MLICTCPYILAKIYAYLNGPNVQTEDNLNLSGSSTISLHDLQCLFCEYFLLGLTITLLILNHPLASQDEVALAYIFSIKKWPEGCLGGRVG